MKTAENSLQSKQKNSTAGATFQKFSAVIILVAIIVIMAIGSENFFKVQNFLNIINQSAYLGVMAIGMTFVIITGGIDLSVGSVMALSGSVMAVAATQWNVDPVAAILLGVVVGIIMGAINGLVITLGRIQPFIATLGMLTAAEGIALLVTGGMPISGLPDALLSLSTKSQGTLSPNILVFAIVAVVGYILLSHTVLGRNSLAIGGNEDASKTAGIKVRATKIIVYAFQGLCCGISALIMLGRTGAGNALSGSGLELQTITAVAIGGTSMTGGTGSIVGTVIGVMTIGVLNNGLDLMNITPYWQKIILGILIVAVVILDSWRKRKFDN